MSPDDILEQLKPRLASIPALAYDDLEAEYIAVLGRKQGVLTGLLKSVAALPAEERKRVGALANTMRQQFESAVEARREQLKREREGRESDVDLTMPARERWVGMLHPVTRVIEEIAQIFRELGFARVVGPEAETEWYNFIALNFPADHPAMDLHDTLYLETGDRRVPGRERRRGRTSGVGEFERRRSGIERRSERSGRVLLRTHTSPVQIRTMLASPPPIRVIMPGLVYRKDAFDASHAPAFQQIEGLAVDEGITLVDLKATLTHFAQRFFSAATRVRFRPSYFPFTEPSAEMDVSCTICGGSGCPACKQTGWMEILGSGMVHPNVLETCGIDPERYTGFAFGMGPGRITMVRHGISDIRQLYEGDMRFLSQFKR